MAHRGVEQALPVALEPLILQSLPRCPPPTRPRFLPFFRPFRYAFAGAPATNEQLPQRRFFLFRGRATPQFDFSSRSPLQRAAA